MISRSLLQEISLTIADLLGWDITQNRISDLKRGLLTTAKMLGVGETSGEIEKWLRSTSWTSKELEILSTSLTVGETYFFREPGCLDVFQKKIISEMVRNRMDKGRSIRIWSAGCCSGEEPYSIAILLREIIPDIEKWDITLLGTDINYDFLKKAEKGSYTCWSFRETPQSFQNHYFTNHGNYWQIDPDIKKMVTFASLNLAGNNYPSAATNTLEMDVIFCRNVLIYFTPEQIKNVVTRFYQSLNENGWLITSTVERNDDYFEAFTTVRFDHCFIYRKSPRQSGTPFTAGNVASGTFPFPTPVPLKKESGPAGVKIKPARRSFLIEKTEISENEENARLLFNDRQYQQCARVCESLLAVNPGNLEVFVLLVKSKANLGLLKDARVLSEKLIARNNAEADHFYLYANILIEEKELEMAVSILKRALYLNPHHLLSHYLLGNLAFRGDNMRMAKKHFQNVRELLTAFSEDDTVPGSDGMTAGRIKKIVDELT